MSAVRTPTRQYEARQAAILAAAVAIMNRKGVRGMTLAEVAAQLDLVPTGVIYYFPKKEELASACFRRGIERLTALIAEGEAEDAAAERIARFVDAYFTYEQRVQTGEAEAIPVFNDIRALDCAPVNEAFIGMFRRARGPLGPQAPADRVAANARTHLLLSEIFWTVIWLPRHDADEYPRVGARTARVLNEGLAAPGVAWPELSLPAIDIARRRDESGEHFLKAATELINEKGYLGASVDKIAARLNVTKGAFYHHHETKDELVVACFERTFDVMRQAIRAAEAAGGSALQVLATAAASLVAYQRSGAAPLLRASALSAAPEAIRPELVAGFDRITSRFAALICDGIGDRSLRPVDANVAAQMVSAMVNAAAELHRWAPGIDPQSAITHYVRPLFEGLAPAQA